MKKPAAPARPATTNECDALLTYLGDVCADDPDLLATVHALADAGETDLLRLVRDFRDNVAGPMILQRHGPAAALDERLRVIHRVYVDCARQVREQSERPVRARKCYEARMLARRDNYQAMLDDACEAMPADVRAAYEKLIHCAREKVPYEALPGRLGSDAQAIQEEVLQLRQRFKEWTARRKVRAESSAPGGVCDG
jgi:hypothetical protein